MSGLDKSVLSGEEADAAAAFEELLPAENSVEFWNVFNLRLELVRNNLSTEITGETSEILEKVKKNKKFAIALQRYAEQSSSELPPYDIKRSQELCDILLKNIKSLEDKYAPKKKFTFSRAAKASSAAAAAAASTTSSSQSATTTNITQTKAPIALPPGSHVIADNNDQSIKLSTSPTTDLQIACQLLIRNNSNTTIELPWYCGSVRLEDNRDCRIVLGPCATSVYLEGLTNCTVFAACHQLRIHNCHGCRLYVRCASHPIIEDCSDMGFAPYALRFEQCEADMNTAGLVQAKCWNNVVDFRWHKPEASPNWFIIPEADRIEINL